MLQNSLSETPEKQTIRAFVDCLNAQAMPDVVIEYDPYSFLTPDVIVTINGTTPLSGRFEGTRIIRKILVNTAQAVISRLEVEIDRLIGKGSSIAALLIIKATTHEGEELNTAGELCGCTFEVKGNHISAIQLFPDTSLIDLKLYGWQFTQNRVVAPDANRQEG